MINVLQFYKKAMYIFGKNVKILTICVVFLSKLVDKKKYTYFLLKKREGGVGKINIATTMLCAMILAVQSITDTLIVSLQVPSTYEKETIVTLSESIEKAFLDDSLVSLLADDLNKSVKDEVTAANFETIIKLATSYKKIGSAEGT